MNAWALAAAVALALVSGCAGTQGQGPSGAADGSPALSYGQDGVHSILPVGGTRVLTLGFVARNRGDEPVVIESVQAVRTLGAAVGDVRVVGTPREIGEVASDVRFPPPDQGNWPPGSVKPLDKGVTLEPGSSSSEWGVNLLLRVDVRSTFALVDQYRVEGKVGGRPFSDLIDVRTAICTDTDSLSSDCRGFAEEHEISV